MSIEHMAMVYAAGGIPGPEKALLLAFTNFTDPHGYCWPGEDRLADMTGTSVRTVRRSRAKLVGMNLIKSVRRTDKATGDPITNLTRVNLGLIASMRRPDPVYDDNMIDRIVFDVDEEEPAKTAPDLLTGQSVLRQGTDCPVGQDRLSCGTGQIGLLSVSEPSVEPSGDSADAPSGRSPVDGRSPSTSGSSASAREGGFAASGKTSPSPTPNDDTRRPARDPKNGSKKAAHTREQLDVVRRVRALFPPELLENGLPDLPTLSSAILAAMAEGRTVEQMGERIWYRWANHGFADIWAEEGRFEKPVGVAVALVRPLRRGDRFACPDLRCENGASLDTKVPCRLCAERIADWKAERARKHGRAAPRGASSVPLGAGSPDAALPPQRTAQPSAPLLRDCANDQCPTSVPTTGNPLCHPCQDDQAEAEQATRDMLAAWETEKAAAAGEEGQPKEVDEDALETARLRAELAAQYGTPEQQAAYCGSNAPF